MADTTLYHQSDDIIHAALIIYFKLINLIPGAGFYSLEVVHRYRDPQLQVSENQQVSLSWDSDPDERVE